MSSGTRKGGSNGEVIAKEFAQSRGDYAETQAATTGMDWLTEAVVYAGGKLFPDGRTWVRTAFPQFR